jgi:hypothetical protein
VTTGRAFLQPHPAAATAVVNKDTALMHLAGFDKLINASEACLAVLARARDCSINLTPIEPELQDITTDLENFLRWVDHPADYARVLGVIARVAQFLTIH